MVLLRWQSNFLFMPDINPDVKTTAESSTAVVEKVASAETTKATTSPSEGAKEPQSMAEVAAQVAKEHGIELEKSPVSKTEDEGKKVEENKEETPLEGEKKTEQKTDEIVIDETNPPATIPYERFREVNEKAKEFETRYQAVEPVVKTHKEITEYCRTNGISQDQFREGLQLLSIINSDPAKAVEALSSLVEQLQGFVGDKLPEDLQKKVDDGKLEVADAKEIASLRAKAKYGESKSKQTKETQERDVERKFIHDVQTATTAWEKNVLKTDLDMREGSEKQELVLAKYRTLATERDASGNFVHPIYSPEDHVALFQKAYDFVNKFQSKFVKSNKPVGKKVLTSTASSVTAEVEPKSMQDIARSVGAKHGISI